VLGSKAGGLRIYEDSVHERWKVAVDSGDRFRVIAVTNERDVFKV